MKKYKNLLIAIPVICAILALNGAGNVFKVGVAASSMVILLMVYNVRIRKDIWIFITALFFSIIGDWFLDNRNGIPARFIYGILFFFFGHVGFFWFSLKNGKINWWILSVLLLGYLILFFVMIYPNIDNSILMTAVLGYLLISCLSLAAAGGLRFPALPKSLFVAGIASIVFSDTIIAFSEFAGYREYNQLIMPTYYLSHILMTLALIINSNNSIYKQLLK
ncbi:lysoplasmalogenase family protein [Proteiniphilum sp.]|uniref:lysoplasmalogenase family protein n=1 Tax=Proteiniphilum sp. TaxID=1926877 RepID=UPI002B1F4EE1|nr:lysoplasmalogenase family protein [Proteiniphilum sp.]MEA4918814.1 lysoplasmalogenase family protein [Proteiniphilum sp.]